MHTRSHLILQDIELLKAFANKLEVGVSITSDNDSIRTEFEPNAPSLDRRLELIKTLRNNNIDVFASLAPILPCSPERLVGLLKPLVSRVRVDSMRYLDINNKPELLQKYSAFFNADNQAKVMNTIMSCFPTRRQNQCTDAVKYTRKKVSEKKPVQLTLAFSD